MRRRQFAAILAFAAPSLALAAPERIRMFELYQDNLSFSATANKLKGSVISMQGFMAPHLKVESDFSCSRTARWRHALSAPQQMNGSTRSFLSA